MEYKYPAIYIIRLFGQLVIFCCRQNLLDRSAARATLFYLLYFFPPYEQRAVRLSRKKAVGS